MENIRRKKTNKKIEKEKERKAKYREQSIMNEQRCSRLGSYSVLDITAVGFLIEIPQWMGKVLD